MKLADIRKKRFKFGARGVRFKNDKDKDLRHQWWSCQITPNVQILLWRCRRNKRDPKIYYIAFARRRVLEHAMGGPIPKIGDDFEYNIAGGLKDTPQKALDVTYKKLLNKFTKLGGLLGYDVEQ